MKYLTEESLSEVLKEIFPSATFIHDEVVLDSSIKGRPDYRCEELKLIVEFDGDQHYRNVKKIKNELKKDLIYSGMGYNIVRIPYFVQISALLIEKLFNKGVKYQQTFPHGFISKTVIMPCDFCELGIKKFEMDLDKFSYAKTEIINSLKEKAIELGDKELVVPPSLEYLLDQ
jgi:hypothetical protein